MLLFLRRLFGLRLHCIRHLVCRDDGLVALVWADMWVDGLLLGLVVQGTGIVESVRLRRRDKIVLDFDARETGLWLVFHVG